MGNDERRFDTQLKWLPRQDGWPTILCVTQKLARHFRRVTFNSLFIFHQQTSCQFYRRVLYYTYLRIGHNLVWSFWLVLWNGRNGWSNSMCLLLPIGVTGHVIKQTWLRPWLKTWILFDEILCDFKMFKSNFTAKQHMVQLYLRWLVI